MAGDWIAMRHDLLDCPQVVRILSAMCPQDVRNVSKRYEIIGALFRTWCLFDRFTVDGILIGYNAETLDAEIGIPGWAADLQHVGWLIIEPQQLSVPEFTTYFGQSAKRRLVDAKRKKHERQARPQSVHNGADKMRTTEQNRTVQKSKKKTPLPPFVIPTVEEVQAYSDEAKLELDAAHFVDFYTAKDWLVGKTKMRDWKAAARNASRDGWCRVGFSKRQSVDEYARDRQKRISRTRALLDRKD